MRRPCMRLLLAFVFILSADASFGQPQSQDPAIAVMKIDGTLLTLTPGVAYETVVVQVVGPGGYQARKVFGATRPIALDLVGDGYFESTGAELPAENGESTERETRQPAALLFDGVYRWAAFFSNALGGTHRTSGRFSLGGAAPVDEDEGELRPPVIPADPSVESTGEDSGAGNDPLSAEHFDFVDIRDFADDGVVDVSLESDVPGSDTDLEWWRIENSFGTFQIVEAGSGGLTQVIALAIPDDGNGEIGIGTSVPGQQLHILGGDFVGLRIEDTEGNTGVWDVETAFGDLRFQDAGTGRIPFTVEDGARSDALVVNDSSRIGLGTTSPSAALELRFETPDILLSEEDDDFASFRLHVDSADGDRLFTLKDGFNGEPYLTVEQGTGATTFFSTLSSSSSGAHLSSGGEWVSASTRALKENIRPLEIEEALAALEALRPVEFNYKVEPDDLQVGFIAEEVPGLVATPDRKGLAAMDVVGVLTRVVQEQQRTIETLQSRLALLEGGR